MPSRAIPLVTGQLYHVFNRTLDNNLVFHQKRLYNRALITLWYYQFKNPGMRLSKHLLLPKDNSLAHLLNLKKENSQINVIAYCLMPNHYHLLLEQVVDQGIQTFASNFQNSFTRYYNTKQERIGSLFLPRFKAVRIENNEQALHVSRYIHLNPYSGYVVDTIEKLLAYPPTSLQEYLCQPVKYPLTKPRLILDQFKDVEQYIRFCQDNADYQRTLSQIKHLCFD